ncbi:MAG: EamA family transporter, partial [Desulfonatronovibrionaceae bacterium]
GPARAALIYYTLPLFSGLGAYVLLGEPVGWIHALSAVMILGGIVIATRH